MYFLLRHEPETTPKSINCVLYVCKLLLCQEECIQVLCVRCAELQDIITWVILSKQHYINMSPFISHYIAIRNLNVSELCAILYDCSKLWSLMIAWGEIIKLSERQQILFWGTQTCAYRVVLNRNQCNITENRLSLMLSNQNWVFVLCCNITT